MDDLLVYIARELVSNPDEVNVKKTERGNTVVFELSVAPEDTGKIIGAHGVRGEIKVFPLTDNARRFLSMKKCYLTGAKLENPIET
ncbi:MAG: KH domain-containing protein, partial [Clostridiales bacterium]|nr:KH domain-containing protein [Clostridiales bacterium]